MTVQPNETEWAAIRAALTPQQVERIKAKCAWEHMSWRGVYADWPRLFVPSSFPDGQKDGDCICYPNMCPMGCEPGCPVCHV